MPTYDYKCLECDIQFEKFQGITAPPLEECPECNGKVKRLIGAGAGLIFKGSGFYITDYRSEGYKESAKKDKNASSDKSEKSKKKEKKTDTSSESKTKPSDSD
ncbi:zinc ribbon domain-containing protein [Candidatus Poribacteria bacterium]|nr:zinc ribbon domain-containing protein [Candidatus Poribacteria bacterium]